MHTPDDRQGTVTAGGSATIQRRRDRGTANADANANGLGADSDATGDGRRELRGCDTHEIWAGARVTANTLAVKPS